MKFQNLNNINSFNYCKFIFIKIHVEHSEWQQAFSDDLTKGDKQVEHSVLDVPLPKFFQYIKKIINFFINFYKLSN